jgi:hypothetical protein
MKHHRNFRDLKNSTFQASSPKGRAAGGRVQPAALSPGVAHPRAGFVEHPQNSSGVAAPMAGANTLAEVRLNQRSGGSAAGPSRPVGRI